ncbi:hypothetical protein [Rickettsia endosymbiont of Orchestes rusci]
MVKPRHDTELLCKNIEPCNKAEGVYADAGRAIRLNSEIFR